MTYIKVNVYSNGKAIFNHLYSGNDQVKALVKFRKEYPEYKDCILIAETYKEN